ncbi:hypothetical protein [uncultured Porphyromonas sp.]|uniref:hypothetical protein n=1 Tax=uncultured Porphyromonas sp. TaxID=159274 RepID=UPI00263741CD|nr:hypothetical protein [uncultured Porphyromonas sp.]
MENKATLLGAVETCTTNIDQAIALTESLGRRLTGKAEVTNDDINYRLKEIKSLLVDLYGEVDNMPRS